MLASLTLGLENIVR